MYYKVNTIFNMQRTLTLFFVSLFLILGFTNCSNEEVNITQPVDFLLEYSELLNISYGNDIQQVYDIYLPENRTLETKVIILVHGGGWTSGDKESMNGFKDLIREQLPDYAIVNINYRLADESNEAYPMQINDITAIINDLKVNSSAYVISESFGFIGVSAGAHLSLLWSYGFDTENNIEMTCSIVGPTNFTDPAYLNNTNPEIQEALETYGINTTTAYLEEISPYHQATTTSPPTILFYGALDPLVPTSQGVAMETKLTELGVIHEFTLYPNEGHGWVGINLFDTWNKLKTFTQLHL